MNARQVHNPDTPKPAPFRAVVAPMPGETPADWMARDMAARCRAEGHMGRLPGANHHAGAKQRMPEMIARRDRLFVWMTGKQPMTLGDIANEIGHDRDATKNDLYSMMQDGRVTLHPSNNSYRLYGAVKPVTVVKPIQRIQRKTALRRAALVVSRKVSAWNMYEVAECHA